METAILQNSYISENVFYTRMGVFSGSLIKQYFAKLQVFEIFTGHVE